MKILLLGEYSGLHLTLAQGLKAIGHSVTLASDGDGFKNYDRDIDLKRKSSSIRDTLSNLIIIIRNLKNFKNYDVVQIINPNFTNLNTRINLLLYRYLKKNNKKIFLGAFGDDYYWLKACLDKKFKYSEFYIDGKENKLPDNNKLKTEWIGTHRQKANIEIAKTCDGIIACLYEYYIAYKGSFKDKLIYIPLPINTDELKPCIIPIGNKIIFFIGVNKPRDKFKGTDILFKKLVELENKYPNDIEVVKAESVTYDKYIDYVKKSHIVLDQLYSYTPAMNALLALALGKVLVGGGEPEMYALLGENDNKPIVNVFPSEKDIFLKLESLIQNRLNLPTTFVNSRKFVEDHHDYINVAQQYINFWNKK